MNDELREVAQMLWGNNKSVNKTITQEHADREQAKLNLRKQIADAKLKYAKQATFDFATPGEDWN